MVRITPFLEHCHLPILPGGPPLGGHVLSHDQVEATLMRRAGYEVRVLPVENGSWEENPPTMLEFAKRDVRWCQGNMQYVKLLDTAGPLSDEPLPARLGDPDVRRHPRLDADDRAAAGGCLAGADDRRISRPAWPSALYIAFFLMYLMPKIAGLLDVVLTRGGVARYGGALALPRGRRHRARLLVPAGRRIDHPHHRSS